MVTINFLITTSFKSKSYEFNNISTSFTGSVQGTLVK